MQQLREKLSQASLGGAIQTDPCSGKNSAPREKNLLRRRNEP
jgi:hypothetical protein